MSTTTAAPVTHRPPQVEPQHRRELVPVRPAASAAVQHATRITRTVLDLYPGDAALIASLRLRGVRRIHGIFDAADFTRAAVAAGLYCMPASGWARADASAIRSAAQALAEDAAKQPWWARWALMDPTLEAIDKLEERGALARTIFPDGTGFPAEGRDTPVRVYYPQPAPEHWTTIHSARLAGLTVGVALPPQALEIETADLCAAVRPQISPRVPDADPIVYGTKGGRAVVLGFYACASSDPPALRSLVATLQTLTVDL